MSTPLEVPSDLVEELHQLRQRVDELERERKELPPGTARPIHLSTDYYKLLYEDTPSMSFALSPDGTILSVNRFGADQLGYSPETLVGQSVLTVFDPVDHHTVREQLTACTGHPYKILQWEIQKVRHNGARLWVRETARAVRDINGTLIVLVICEDITAQKAAEEQSHGSVQALQTLIHMSPLAVMALDTTGETVTLWNQAAESMFGWRASEVLGRPTPFLPSGKQEESDRLWDTLLREGSLSGAEFRRTRRDGALIDLALWATMLRNPQGNVIGTLGFLADVTERNRAIEALRESEQRLKSIIQTSPECIKLVAADGTLLEINPAGLAMIEAERPEDVIGRSVYSLVAPAHRESFQAMNEQVCRGNNAFLEFEIIGMQGTHRWMETHAVPLHNPTDGRIVQLAVTRNITERKQDEEALRQNERNLQRLLEDRERISQDLHDNLLQSLYAVGTGLEVAKRRIKRASPVNAKRLEGSVAQLNAVIREVRSFIPRMYAPAISTKNVADGLRSLARSFVATGGGIALTVDSAAAMQVSPEQSPHILAIAKEALSNSVRHTKADNRSIALTLYRGQVRLEVADDGEGFQLRERRKLGMGIRNMRARAAKLNARFSIRTSVGKGTRLTLTLPLRT